MEFKDQNPGGNGIFRRSMSPYLTKDESYEDGLIKKYIIIPVEILHSCGMYVSNNTDTLPI